MPNNLNYPDSPLTIQSRPDRLSEFDIRLLTTGFKSVLFGTTPDDLVEVYFYDSNNNIDSHINLYVPSDALSLTSVVDISGNSQYLNIDLPKVVDLVNILPGRYSMVLNFFRNEVGKEEGNHLYIKEISPSRTELKLVPFFETSEIFHEMYEFIIPSITKLFAQALLSEVFGFSVDALENEKVTPEGVLSELNSFVPNTLSRIEYSHSRDSIVSFISSLIHKTYSKSVDLLSTGDRNIQKVELQQFISDAFDSAVSELQPSLDTRFNLI